MPRAGETKNKVLGDEFGELGGLFPTCRLSLRHVNTITNKSLPDAGRPSAKAGRVGGTDMRHAECTSGSGINKSTVRMSCL